MTIDEFIQINNCPTLFHMAEKGQWQNILKLGLLSTSALLDECNIGDPQRDQIESSLRPKKISISHPQFGIVTIRDQIPMKDWPEQDLYLDDFLEDGISKSEWLKLLNSKVFFWPNKEDLIKMICAWQYAKIPQWVIEIDTKKLLETYQDQTYVSYQNSGSLYSRRKRGKSTFVPFNEHDPRYKVIEVVVERGIPDIECFAITVRECIGFKQDGRRIFQEKEVIWENENI